MDEPSFNVLNDLFDDEVTSIPPPFAAAILYSSTSLSKGTGILAVAQSITP
jgi:hypothetical protein